MTTTITDAQEFRRAGASVQILAAAGRIDGERCEALSQVPGISASGALRVGDSVTPLNLPTNPYEGFEVTPGLLGTLSGGARASSGIWLSGELSKVLGAAPGDEIATAEGPALVGAVFDYPDDGRDRRYAFGFFSPVPAHGAFDACWAEVWPVSIEATALLNTAIIDSPDAEPVERFQLNARLGASHDAHGAFASRLTLWAPYGSIAVGIVLGVVAVRMRRLELAATLHARVPRSLLSWQLVLEAAAWIGGALILCAPALWWITSTWLGAADASGASAVVDPRDARAIWVIGMRTVGAGAAGAFVGVGLAGLSTREKHLFKYFKER